ncbi:MULTISPECIES: helix-turn-helix domain-containing protein [Fischerella]|uniref:XRE family transcriptional regulator n=1 Tax=Fischerella muscicola CCMEE 5323 TaxID=2019572 RepID=A0A2N6JXH1_FISMU|nr:MULTISPECIES: helix-turn-helix transcriptional regulator [Fischerella]MBD2432746.1 helix-turn-helix transcriptional regulator [Fischerella sp. FACHB-380]PLZ85159.1 XRE family transcriptional regulator [Fischerella muscicola CCMEE 5323]
MPIQNRVKSFLEARDLSAYQFIKDTGIAPATGYKLAKKSSYLPSVRVLEVICDTYKVQPSELLEWVEEQKSLMDMEQDDENV